MKKQVLQSLAMLSFLLISTSATALDTCKLASSDSDGDGWGWENGRSCLVVEQGVAIEENYCSYRDADLYNGWGYDSVNKKSCPPLNTAIEQELPDVSEETVNDGSDMSSDCDYSSAGINNGWGWSNTRNESCPPTTLSDPDNSEVAEAEEVAEGIGNETTSYCNYDNAAQHNGFGWDDVNKVSCPPRDEAGKISFNAAANSKNVKVLVSSGQSNSLGERTEYSDFLDYPVNNVIVWTSENGWQVANLCRQVWDRKWYPKAGGTCSNHPGFQIAKNLALLNPDDTIALIPTGKAGQPISCWDDDKACFLEMEFSIETALDSLEFTNVVSYMAFLQGESDSGRSQWYNDLQNLIARIESRNWYDGQFIASQTFAYEDINQQVTGLRFDGNSRTDYVSSAGLQTKDGTHWNAPALRMLGIRFADRFTN